MRRTWFPSALLAIALAAPAGCKSDEEKRCERYVDLQIKCGEDADITAEEKEALRMIAGGMCQAALTGTLASGENKSDVMIEMQASIRAEVECMEQAKGSSCDAWKSCQRD